MPTSLLVPQRELLVFAAANGSCVPLAGASLRLVDVTSPSAPQLGMFGASAAAILSSYNVSSVPSYILRKVPVSAFAGRDLMVLAIRAGVLRRGRSYSLHLQGDWTLPWEAVSSLMDVDLGPIGGAVQVYPLQGAGVTTPFRFSTFTWSSQLPLNFAYWRQAAPVGSPLVPLCDWQLLPNWTGFLPPGQWQIHVSAIDSLGVEALSTLSTGPVQVGPSDMSGIEGYLTFVASMPTAQRLTAIHAVALSLNATESGRRSSVAQRLLGSLTASSSCNFTKLGAMLRATILSDLSALLMPIADNAAQILTLLQSSLQNALRADSQGAALVPGLSPDNARTMLSLIAGVVSSFGPTTNASTGQQAGQLAETVGRMLVSNLRAAKSQTGTSSTAEISEVSVAGLQLLAASIPAGSTGRDLLPGFALAGGLPTSAVDTATQQLRDAGFFGYDPSLGLVSSKWAGAGPYGQGSRWASMALGDSVTLALVLPESSEVIVQDLALPIRLVIPLARSGLSASDLEQMLLDDSVPECRWWDEQHGDWSTGGCRALSISSDGRDLLCSCTHLTAFGAFPSVADKGLLALGSLEEMFLSSLLCANVNGLFTLVGAANLQLNPWWSRPSGQLYFCCTALFVLCLLGHLLLDLWLARCHGEVLEELAEVVDELSTDEQEIVEVTLWGRFVRWLNFLPVSYKGRQRWKKEAAELVVLTVVGCRLGVCAETMKLFLGAAAKQRRWTDDSPLSKMATSVRMDLALAETCQTAYTGAVAEFKQGGRLRLLHMARLFIAWHPLREALDPSLPRLHFARAQLLLSQLVGSIAVSGFFFLGENAALSVDSPSSCHFTTDSRFLMHGLVAGLGSMVLARLPNVLLTRVEPLRVQSRARPLRNKLKAIGFYATEFLLIMFYLLYIAAFLANIQEQSAWLWMQWGALWCFIDKLLITPLRVAVGFTLRSLILFRLEPTLLDPPQRQTESLVIMIGPDELSGTTWSAVENALPVRATQQQSFDAVLPSSCPKGTAMEHIEDARATKKRIQQDAMVDFLEMALPGSVPES